jgi:Flp pilus assembly protein TadD
MIKPTMHAAVTTSRSHFLPLLLALATTAPGVAAVPTQPLLTPQAVPLDDMVMAERAYAANDPAEALARYLRVLAQNPRDLNALTGAGRAAIDIGDANAAVSFYARAEELSPRDGRIKAGLGSAMVQLVQPRSALRLFEDAVSLGVPVADIASDRGLAYALRGDSKRARADFELALANRPNPETIRRLAITQAIDGDMPGALARLDPLLRKQDKAAWRDRVFILAIRGDISAAQATAKAMLPPQQADALMPFLDRIGKLRPGQQAAAVHFGQFPSDGRKYSEDELFAAAGSTQPPPVAPAVQRRPGNVGMSDDQGDGVIDDDKAASTGRDRSGKKARTARESQAQETLTAKKPDVWATTERSSFTLPAQSPKTASTLPVTAAKSEPVSPKAEAKPVTATAPVTPQPAPATLRIIPKAPASTAAAVRIASLASSTEVTSKKTADPKKPLEKTSAKTAKDDKKTDTGSKTGTSKGKNPERHWVQVATGAYKPDLGKEWGKLKQKYAALLGKRSAWTTPLNRTHRLLIGPFKTSDEAQAFVNKAAGGGFMTSPFTSPAGQVVDPIQ